MKRGLGMIRNLVVGALFAAATGSAFAHGFAGKRFFPATLATEDPFVADELSLPTVSRRKTGASGDEPAALVTETSVDFTKRITQNFGIGLGATWVDQKPDDGERVRGFDNFAANVKYQFFKSDEHETIMSVGLDWDIGNTGAKRIIGTETFSTLTPTIFAGKGFGDLPDSLPYLKPFAVTGSL